MTPLNTTTDCGPEFVDHQGLTKMFGIKRSLAYALMCENKIKGVSLRRPGQLRGKRLFNVASVRSYLHSCQEVE